MTGSVKWFSDNFKRPEFRIVCLVHHTHPAADLLDDTVVNPLLTNYNFCTGSSANYQLV